MEIGSSQTGWQKNEWQKNEWQKNKCGHPNEILRSKHSEFVLFFALHFSAGN